MIQEIFGPKARLSSLSVRSVGSGLQVDGLVATPKYVGDASGQIRERLWRVFGRAAEVNMDQVVLADPSRLQAASKPAAPAPDPRIVRMQALRDMVPFTSATVTYDPKGDTTGDYREVFGLEHSLAGDQQPAKAGSWPRIHRQRVAGGVAGSVERDVALAELHEGVGFLRQFQFHPGLGAQDLGRQEGLAGLEIERLPRQIGGIGPGSGDADGPQAILRPQGDRQRHGERRSGDGLADGYIGVAVVVAFGLHQPVKQALILLCARLDLVSSATPWPSSRAEDARNSRCKSVPWRPSTRTL